MTCPIRRVDVAPFSSNEHQIAEVDANDQQDTPDGGEE
jgi:hypothetical protein